MAGRREYRAAELAEAAGITERTLRYYRERRLLPPPRRAGRVAWYDERHLARLRTIDGLLARGHTLGGIAELLTAFTEGRDAGHTAELLGLREPRPWVEERPVRLTPERLAAYFADPASADLAAALEIGYVAVDGEELVHVSRDLLEASAALAGEGIPLSAMLAAGRQLRAYADALADIFTGLLREHVLPEILAPGHRRPLAAEDVRRLTEALERLRPLAKKAVYAEVSLALDRRLDEDLTPDT
ncbi:MerR family transcriptional regulator [Streptomyces sp. NPDC049881]|uniref:MerR family transcriptional regulator n=1 Tax=Streptomyces sp. NPDC049881 TaxID=3155778 RepID=UPI0034340EFF